MLNYKQKARYITIHREPFFAIAEKYIKKGDCVLDVGCGMGEFADFLGKKSIYMLDGNEETINNLRDRFPYVYHAILPNLPFPDEKFDLIHCSHLIEHLDSDTMYETMKAFDRCLRPGGYLVISSPVMWYGFYDDLSHLRPYSLGVFHHYLMASEYHSITRPRISQLYILMENVKRYNYKPPLQFTVVRGGLIGWVIKKSCSALSRIISSVGIRRLQVTGETIVLRKGEGEINDVNNK